MDVLVKGMSADQGLLVMGLVDTDLVERARMLHDTYPTASAAFGRIISGALLLSSLLKEGQKLMVQVVGEGPLKEVVAEADWKGRVRGYVYKPHVHLGLKEGKLDVGRAFGNGYLNVIKDLGLRDRYQGSVPLQTGEIATDLAYYLRTSEQIPAAVSLGVHVDTDNAVKASGGFMIHALPDATDEVLEYLEERLKGVRPVSSMILEGAGPKEILDEALGLPYDIIETKEVMYFCPCSKGRVLDALAALGRQDIEEMVRKGETVEIQCQFCKTEYAATKDELLSLLEERGGAEG